MSCCGKAGALGAEIKKWASKGFPLADYQKRINICKDCESFMGRFCKHCGCMMTIKARMATTICPIGKWTNDA